MEDGEAQVKATVEGKFVNGRKSEEVRPREGNVVDWILGTSDGLPV